MSNRFPRVRWIEEWVARIWAVLKAVWCFTRSLVVEEKRETEQQNGGRCRVKKEFLHGFLFTVVSLVVLWFLDPLDVASTSARSSAELFYRIVSPGYAAPTRPENAGSPDMQHDDTQIAVIVINDATLQRWEALRGEEAYWPPAFSVHAQIIEKILIYNPKALLIDFGFFDAQGRGDITELTDVMFGLRYKQLIPTETACVRLFLDPQGCHPDDGRVERRIPVFLAGAPRPFNTAQGSNELEVVQALKDAVTGTVSTRYSTKHELPYNSYPLFDCFTKKPSAALAMYAAYRTDWTNWGLDLTSCSGRDERDRRDWAGGPNAMSVYWASWGDEAHSRGSYSCKSVPETVPGRIVQVVKAWLADLLGDDMAWREQFQACPPHRAYAAHDFLADESTELAEFLEDRYVFYGGNFAMAEDMITPPTHGPVPGVFLHAMALDNLLQYGGEYKRVEGGAWPRTWSFWLTVLAIFLVSFFSVMAWNGLTALMARPEKMAAPKPTTDPAWSKAEVVWSRLRPFGRVFIGGAWFAIFITVSGASVVAIVWFEFSVLNLAPINFVGILAFIGVEAVIRTSRALVGAVFSGL